MQNFYKYLPVTAAEEQWGFYVNTVGYTRINPQQRYPPAKGHPASHAFTWNKGRILSGYYLVFISRGQGVFESRKTPPTRIAEGTCFFLFPEMWHRYRPDPDSGWEEYWVGFKGRYPDSLVKTHFFQPGNPFLEVGLDESLLVLFQRLLEIVQHAQPGYHQIITGVVLEMLALVHTLSQHKRRSGDITSQLIDKAIFLMRESLDKPLGLEMLARELPMGYSKFRKVFKAVTGYSPHEYHLALRIERARELLGSTTLAINEVAYQTGFESAYYFSKIFKKKSGTSPSRFRAARRNAAAPGRPAAASGYPDSLVSVSDTSAGS